MGLPAAPGVPTGFCSTPSVSANREEWEGVCVCDEVEDAVLVALAVLVCVELGVAVWDDVDEPVCDELGVPV